MDINEKVEQLLQITMSLKNELDEIKGSDLNAKLNELEWEKEALKNDIIDLRHSLTQQTEKILSLIRKQNDKLVETIEGDKLAPHLVFSKKISKHAKLFPIKSMKELVKMEAYIGDKNLNELVSVVQQLLAPKGIVKNIGSVLSTECIVDCNVDGIQNKKRLLNYPKFMDLLFRAAYSHGYSQKNFLDEVRRGLKTVKNRHNAILFRNRQLQRQQEEYSLKDYEEESQIEPIDELEILPDQFIKKEKYD